MAREKALAFHFSYRHGLALIHSIEASVRTGMKSLMWQEVSLGSLMHETAKDDCLAYVYLIDGNGIVIHHSNPSKDGTSADWKPAIASENQVVIVLSVLMALGVAFLRGSLRGTNGDQQMHSQSNTKQIHKKFVM